MADKTFGAKTKSKSSIGRRSRQKGAEGEIEVRNLFRKYGFEARRGQQHRGGADSPDVIHNIEWLHVESKRVNAGLNLRATVDKAQQEAPFGAVSAVFHRKDRQNWLVTVDAEVFMQILRKLEKPS